jgi:hypothetical protein
MICRFSAGAAALALAAFASAPAPARAQSQTQTPPIVINIEGPCAMALDGRATECAGVAYMVFPANHRIDFAAIAGQAGLAFSGGQDSNQGGRYTLTVDSVVSPRVGRLQAQGQCVMDMEQDAVTVSAIECRAQTAAGVMQLKASGVAKSGEGGDDDDDEDNGPASAQG